MTHQMDRSACCPFDRLLSHNTNHCIAHLMMITYNTSEIAKMKAMLCHVYVCAMEE